MEEIANDCYGNKGDCFFTVKTVYKTDEGYIKIVETNGWGGHKLEKYSFCRPRLGWLLYQKTSNKLIEDIKESYKDKIKDIYKCKYLDKDDIIRVKKFGDFNLIYIFRVADAGEDYDGEYILAREVIGEYEFDDF